MLRRTSLIAAVGVLGVALALRFSVGMVSPTMIWPDEIFQSLEQAHRLVWGYGIVPWEFRVGARSWLLPGMLAGVMRLTAWAGSGSSGYLAGARLWLCLVSLSIPASAFALARPRTGTRGAVVAGLAVALWFELVYFGLTMLQLSKDASRPRTWAVAGLLLGLTVALRMHLGPAVGVALVVASWRASPGQRVALMLGCVAPILLAGAIDDFTWGSFFKSYIVNVSTNLTGRSVEYGASPWYGYFLVLGRVWGWVTPALLLLAAIGAVRAPLLAVAAVVTFATHAAFGHKEYRFMLPTIALIVVLAGDGLADVCRRCERRFASATGLRTLVPVLALLGWSTVCLDRAASYDWLATSLAGPSGEPPFMWHHLRGSLQAFEALSKDSRVCGVGLENRHWTATGGYTYLHRHVPIFEVDSDDAYRRYGRSFNFMIVHADAPAALGGLQRDQCFDDVCIYHRDGECLPLPGYDLNETIAARHM